MTLALRRNVYAVWLAPLAVVLVRVLLDPLSFGWYWLEAEALVLVAAGVLRTDLPVRFARRVTLYRSVAK